MKITKYFSERECIFMYTNDKECTRAVICRYDD